MVIYCIWHVRFLSVGAGALFPSRTSGRRASFGKPAQRAFSGWAGGERISLDPLHAYLDAVKTKTHLRHIIISMPKLRELITEIAEKSRKFNNNHFCIFGKRNKLNQNNCKWYCISPNVVCLLSLSVFYFRWRIWFDEANTCASSFEVNKSSRESRWKCERAGERQKAEKNLIRTSTAARRSG